MELINQDTLPPGILVLTRTNYRRGPGVINLAENKGVEFALELRVSHVVGWHAEEIKWTGGYRHAKLSETLTQVTLMNADPVWVRESSEGVRNAVAKAEERLRQATVRPVGFAPFKDLTKFFEPAKSLTPPTDKI